MGDERILLALGGCLTAAVVGAFDATNLSGLRPGMSAAQTHKILGQPEKTEMISGGKVERFTYDRGINFSKLEKQNDAVKALLIMGTALGDAVSWGQYGLLCTNVPKGLAVFDV